MPQRKGRSGDKRESEFEMSENNLPLGMKDRKDGFMKAAKAFNTMPNAENWMALKRWMLYRQAPQHMNMAQALKAYKDGLGKDFDDKA